MSVDVLSILVSPKMKEIVSEKLQFSLQFLVVFLHLAYFLLQCLHIRFGNSLELELENLDSQLHLGVVIERNTGELILVDPSLELLDILIIEKSVSSEFFLGCGALHSDVQIWLSVTELVTWDNLCVLRI
jgi:hypothetical protein